MWFDTAACLSGGHIGDVNKVTINPANDAWYKKWTSACTESEL